MARNQRNDNRPSRDRGHGGRSATGSTRRTRQSTAQTVAQARRKERLDELRRQRDRTESAIPDKADRPDFGHRPNVAEVGETSTGRRAGLIGGGVVVLLIAALVVGYLTLGGPRSAPAAGGRPSTSAAAPASMVDQQTMLSADEASSIVDGSWTVQNDQAADEKGAPVPACLGDVSKDAPKPTETLIRTLSADGDGKPTALHLAEAYRTPELATEAYALLAKALGECQLKGSYISGARVISGLGDQATAISLEDLIKDSHRAVVLNRTGRMINVVDVSATKSAPDLDKTAEALGRLTDLQCTIAVGLCASAVQISDGPPPVAGDQPGFLATADIPQPTNGKGHWGGLEPGSPENVTTSGCENVDFNALLADNRTARSYVLDDNPKGMPKKFGIDEITLTMQSKKDAETVAKSVVDNLKSCDSRLPTADVTGVEKVSGTGADGAEIAGSIAAVNQKVSAEETSHYRVGIVAAGTKLVYTFMYREGDWDVTKDQWAMLTVRAGERATQVR